MSVVFAPHCPCEPHRRKQQGQCAQMQPCPAHSHHGFSLIEVLVALVVIAVAATAVLSLSREVLVSMGRARNQDELAMLAWGVMQDQGRKVRHPAVVEGSLSPPNEHCTYDIRTESVDLGSAVVGGGDYASASLAKGNAAKSVFLVRTRVQCGNDDSITLESLGE